MGVVGQIVEDEDEDEDEDAVEDTDELRDMAIGQLVRRAGTGEIEGT